MSGHDWDVSPRGYLFCRKCNDKSPSLWAIGQDEPCPTPLPLSAFYSAEENKRIWDAVRAFQPEPTDSMDSAQL